MLMTGSRTLLASSVIIAAIFANISSFAWVGITPSYAADAEAGKAKFESCTACHGPNAISAMENVPSLAGQTDSFLQWQLVYFRGGARKSDVMGPIAEGLTDEDIRNLGAYLSHLTPPEPPSGSAPDTDEAVRTLVAQNRCTNCHTEQFTGLKAAARLAGQREDYLLKALRDFKSGARSGSGMAAMADVVYPLSDDDLVKLAHYVASFR
jgi:cytochrome c553